MNAFTLPNIVQPNLLGLLGPLDVPLKWDEEQKYKVVIGAAIATDRGAWRRLGVTQYGLDIISQTRLNADEVRQRILNSSEWLDQSIQAMGLRASVKMHNSNGVLF